jgi:biopolymer transport protein ExbB/TolQ
MNFRHDVDLMMATSIAVIVACLLTWAACHWWYGRKLAAAAHRLHKSDKERAFSRDQTQQARRQLQQVKAELESHQRSASAGQTTAGRHRAAQAEEQRQAAERAAEADSGFMPIVAAHGFADTQILPE